MLCESLRPVIRQFLDDLLDEKDHQEVHGHLENCARCHAFASSVGTLSYQLYELAQVTVPPDIASTVSYQFSQKTPTATMEPVTTVAAPSGDSWKMAALLVAAVTVSVWIYFSWFKQPLPDLPSTVVVTTPAVTVDPASKDPTDLLSHWSPLNRHYHLSKSSQPELVGLLTQLGVAIEHESPALVVFNLSKTQWEDFEGRFEALSGVVKEFGEPQAPVTDEEFVQVSIFLE